MKRIFTILTLLAALSGAGVELPLLSLEDYRYVPTDGVIDVRGIGCGEEGAYRAPRQEDWLFLSESLAERRHVVNSLSSADALVIEKDANYRNAYRRVPSLFYAWDTFAREWFAPGYFSTNGFAHAMIVVPDNLISAAYYSTNVIEDTHLTIPDDVWFGMFQDGSPHIERRLVDLAANPPADWVFPKTAAMVVGFVTNAYHDVIANTSPTFEQRGRTGGGDSYVTSTVNRVYFNYPYGYDFQERRFKCYTNDQTTTRFDRYGPYSTSPCYSLLMFDGYKNAAIACQGELETARTMGSYYETTYTYGTSDVHVCFPVEPSRITSFRTAFAVCDYDHFKIFNMNSTNVTDQSFTRTVAIPVTLSSVGTNSFGYAVYTTGHDPNWYRNQCFSLLRDRITNPPDSIIDTVTDPEYPEPPSGDHDREVYMSNTERSRERIRVDVRYVIGVLDYDFRTKIP